MDPEEVRRLETLIPGTDQETEEDLRYVRRPRRQEPPPPDLPPGAGPHLRQGALGAPGPLPIGLSFGRRRSGPLPAPLAPCLPPPELAVGYPLLPLDLRRASGGRYAAVSRRAGRRPVARCEAEGGDGHPGRPLLRLHPGGYLAAGREPRPGRAALLLSRRPVRSVLPAPRHLSQAVRPSPVLPHRSGRRGALSGHSGRGASGTGRTPTPSGPAPPPALAARSRWTTAPSASTGCSVPSCCWPA